MRLIVFVLTLCAATWAWASEPIAGLIQKDGTGAFIQLNPQGPKFKVIPAGTDVQDNLRKLSHGDLVTGSATIDFDKKEIVLEAIDYVGIKRLLGTWYSPEGLYEVTSFDRLNFYPYAQLDSAGRVKNKTSTPHEFKYSVSPSEGREWVLFLSDKQSTIFATIQITRNRARLKLYDSETGGVSKSLVLVKWGSL